MNIYIVVTYYHLLISIIKCISERGKHDLIIYGDTKDNSLIENECLIKRLEKTGIFKNIYIINYKVYFTKYSDYGTKFQLKRIAVMKTLKKQLDNLHIRNYGNLYIFNDMTTIGKCINKMNLKYILLEDGLDCFKNNSRIVNIKNPIKKYIKKVLYGSYQMGMSKNVIYIEVNNKEGIVNNGNLIVETKKIDLFQSLCAEDSKEVLDVFITNSFEFCNGSNLLITQPLFQDKILASEESQINIYKKILDKYCKNEKVLIKNHPRESIKYEAYFSNVICLDKEFPLEILLLNNNIWFNKVITISSTAIEMFDNCKEKIKLGWEWLDENID